MSTLKQFTSKSDGSSKNVKFLKQIAVFFLMLICLGQVARGDDSREPALAKSELTWKDYDLKQSRVESKDYDLGLSYVISGSIALVGGIAGTQVTSDPLEKGIYALFETIGIASIGYGAYKWQVGDDRRLLMTSLRDDPTLSDVQRLSVMKTYEKSKAEFQKKERWIRAMTHGLIAALNFYNGSQQKQDGVRNTLYFIGGTNLLACLSYSF